MRSHTQSKGAGLAIDIEDDESPTGGHQEDLAPHYDLAICGHANACSANLLSVWRPHAGLWEGGSGGQFLPALDAVITSANSHLEAIDASLPRRNMTHGMA